MEQQAQGLAEFCFDAVSGTISSRLSFSLSVSLSLSLSLSDDLVFAHCAVAQELAVAAVRVGEVARPFAVRLNKVRARACVKAQGQEKKEGGLSTAHNIQQHPQNYQ
jgi:hypothetical protein